VNEDKSTRYHRLKRRTAVASACWSGALLVALLASGAAAALRDVVAGLSAAWWAQTALYMTLLGALHEAGALPLAYYTGHALERRYGLSRQRSRQWALDHAKGAAVGLVLGVGVVLLVYWTMRVSPSWWWAIAAGLFSLLLILFANLAPVVLLPLFFRFRPLERPELRARLERLAGAAGARVMGVFQWDLGEKTVKANAALTGLGRTRRILIADTMLDQYSDDEIEVVLAHELAHHVHGDIWRGIALEAAFVLAGFYAAHQALRAAGPRAGLTHLTDPAGIPLLLLAAGAVSVVLMPAALAVSRALERRADRFALDLTRNPEAFATAMRRLGAQNMAEERPSPLVRWLFYSHPPLEERLERASRWRNGSGGVLPA
jgi:STE24 endopeptidase